MNDREFLKRQTRRSFFTGGVAALAGLSGWSWLTSRRDDAGIPWPFRRVLDLNSDLWREVSKPDRLSPEFPPPPVGKKPRFNGDIGLQDEQDLSAWKLSVRSDDPDEDELTLKLADLQWLPRSETSTEFRCIEGWSDFFSYRGVRFSDFLEHFELGRQEDGSFYPYVGLQTPDGKYYVSIDMESMLHPQTLLATEMNGQPLTSQNGAPLRLIIPIKYGIKSLKRIGSIRFSSTRPPDYWAERGYDWYAGL
jgi:DMSO/TMAO reductase YedYZ molybdopterin-dependent catalytic subunit